MKTRELIEKLEELDVWAVPVGYIGGPQGSNEAAAVLRLKDVQALLDEAKS